MTPNRYPSMQAARALKGLMMARQQHNEDVIDYYRQFDGLIEMTERTYGEISPVVVAKKDKTAYSANPDGTVKTEREKMLAYMFMEGAEKKIYASLMKNMRNDHALGNEKYPETVEEALQVMMLYSEGMHTKKKKDEEKLALGYAQISASKRREMMKKGLCFKCGEKGHRAMNCPKKEEDETDQAHAQISWAG
jgi:hypothetical protein